MNFPTSYPMAFSTMALAVLLPVCVFCIIFMAFGAVSFHSIFQASIAARLIHLMGYRLDVFRVYAATCAAKMIEFQPFWDWPDVKLVAGTVCAGEDSAYSGSHSKTAVAIFISRTKPQPAARIGFRRHVTHEQFYRAKIAFSHVTPFSRIGQGLASVTSAIGACSYFLTLRCEAQA